MKRHGYSGRISTGTLAAGGTLGILIPPSVPLVIYAILTEQNIAKLFAAAMMPGIIAMVGYMIAIAIYVRVVPGQAPDSEDVEKLTFESLKGILPIATIFIIVFGGIYAGFFTPTEGAAVGATSTFGAQLDSLSEWRICLLRDCVADPRDVPWFNGEPGLRLRGGHIRQVVDLSGLLRWRGSRSTASCRGVLGSSADRKSVV